VLRISFTLADSLGKWTLCGQVAGAWVHELRACWEYTRLASAIGRTVVDLSDVTFIDEEGEKLLLEMRSAGVEFVATGIETKHMLENLSSGDERAFRRLV
jgi:anti-anti-sigma regulatory factor